MEGQSTTLMTVLHKSQDVSQVALSGNERSTQEFSPGNASSWVHRSLGDSWSLALVEGHQVHSSQHYQHMDSAQLDPAQIQHRCNITYLSFTSPSSLLHVMSTFLPTMLCNEEASWGALWEVLCGALWEVSDVSTSQTSLLLFLQPTYITMTTFLCYDCT